MDNPKIGALRVWHIPQVPGKPFHVYVDTLQEAPRKWPQTWTTSSTAKVAADLDYQQHRESGRAHRALWAFCRHGWLIVPAVLAVLVFSGCTSDVDTYAAMQADLADAVATAAKEAGK